MDHREQTRKWYSRFDQNRMVLIIEEFETSDGECVDLELPARYEVCSVCDGKGSHVNPSIDSHGLSAEDFAEDPDFREDYFSGVYDVPCNWCGGARVDPVLDETRTTPEQAKVVEEYMADLAAHYAEMAYERRMGC